MGVSHIWVCDARREYIDPYPLDCPHLYIWLQCHVVEGAEGRLTEGWYGESVRLINDSGEQNEFYLRTSQTEIDAQAWGGRNTKLADVAYRDVTSDAKACARKWFPEKWWERDAVTG